MRKRSDKVEGIEDRFLKALKTQSKTELIALIQKIVGQLTPGDREDLLGTQVREKAPKAISPGKGGHLKVTLNGRRSILPMHSSDLKKGTVEGIKKQLGLK